MQTQTANLEQSHGFCFVRTNWWREIRSTFFFILYIQGGFAEHAYSYSAPSHSHSYLHLYTPYGTIVIHCLPLKRSTIWDSLCCNITTKVSYGVFKGILEFNSDHKPTTVQQYSSNCLIHQTWTKQ